MTQNVEQLVDKQHTITLYLF